MTTPPTPSAPDLEDDEDEHARIWDQDEDARSFAEQAFASLLEVVDLTEPGWRRRRVLDFGCGTGLLTAKLAVYVGQVVAVDLSDAMVGVLRDKALTNVEIHRVDIDDDAARASAAWFGGFDVIVASCVCDALPRYAHTLKLLAGALNPGGLFVQWDWLADGDGDADEDDGLTLDQVATGLRDAGLELVRVDEAFDCDASAVLIGVGRAPVAMRGL